jgi:NSS family neurotransmitter:Na+ symporter
LIAGLAIFSSIGHFNPEAFQEGSGIALQSVGLMYQTLPQVFASLGWFGQVVSFLFFAMVTIAALTSVISLLEVATQFVIQKFKVKRKIATLILALICFIVSIPVTWSVGGAFEGAITVFGFDMLTFFDEITNTVLMPVGACISCITIGWLIEKGSFKQRMNPMNTYRALQEDGLDLGGVGKIFAVMVKYVTPILIMLLEVFGVIAKFSEYSPQNLHFAWVLIGAVVLMAVGIAVYFIFFKNQYTGTNEDELLLEKTAREKVES